MNKYQLFMCVLLLINSAWCIAEKNSHPDNDNHDAHQNGHYNTQQKTHLHGFAELTLAIEANTLEIQFASPAANIVGFEHKARHAEQKQVVNNAQSMLAAAKQIFSFSGSSCTVQQVNVDVNAVLGDAPRHKHEGGHHQPHDDSADNHSEISATYYYTCQHGDKLDSITVNLIKYFPAIEKIQVLWLTETQQSATQLTSQSNLILLR